MPASQALAARNQPTAIDVMALATTTDDRRDAARAVVLANSGLVPDTMRGNPAAVLTAMWVCDALDIERTPVNFAQLYSVHGRPGIMAKLQLGLAHRAGHKSRWLTEPDNAEEQALEMDGQTFRFTMAMARTAGITGNDTYKKYPWDMLRWRVVTRAVNGVCPEVLLGLRAAAPDLFTTEAEVVDGPVPVPDLVPTIEAKKEMVQVGIDAGLCETDAKKLAQRTWAEYRLPTKGSGEDGVGRKALNLVMRDFRKAAEELAAEMGEPFDEQPAEEEGTLFGG